VWQTPIEYWFSVDSGFTVLLYFPKDNEIHPSIFHLLPLHTSLPHSPSPTPLLHTSLPSILHPLPPSSSLHTSLPHTLSTHPPFLPSFAIPSLPPPLHMPPPSLHPPSPTPPSPPSTYPSHLSLHISILHQLPSLPYIPPPLPSSW
jgi:hypothetical protein